MVPVGQGFRQFRRQVGPRIRARHADGIEAFRGRERIERGADRRRVGQKSRSA
jgi:hypothetical protein